MTGAAWSQHALSCRCALRETDMLPFHRSINGFHFRQASRKKEIMYFTFNVSEILIKSIFTLLSRIKGIPFFRTQGTILNTSAIGGYLLSLCPLQLPPKLSPYATMFHSNISVSVCLSLTTLRAKWGDNLGSCQTNPDKIHAGNLTEVESVRVLAVEVKKWKESKYIKSCQNKWMTQCAYWAFTVCQTWYQVVYTYYLICLVYPYNDLKE